MFVCPSAGGLAGGRRRDVFTDVQGPRSGLPDGPRISKREPVGDEGGVGVHATPSAVQAPPGRAEGRLLPGHEEIRQYPEHVRGVRQRKGGGVAAAAIESKRGGVSR